MHVVCRNFRQVIGLLLLVLGVASSFDLLASKKLLLIESWKEKLGSAWTWSAVNEDQTIFLVSPQGAENLNVAAASVAVSRLKQQEALSVKEFDLFVEEQSKEFEEDIKKSSGVAVSVLKSSKSRKLIEGIDSGSGKPMKFYWMIVENKGERWLISARVPLAAKQFQQKDIERFFEDAQR